MDTNLVQQERLNSHNTKNMIIAKINLLLKNCNRVLLINPPPVPEDEFDVNVALDKRYPAYPPYGIGIINRILIENGYESNILDLNYEVLSFLNSNENSFRYCIWKEKLRERILHFQPDLIGITCLFTMTAPQMYSVANFVKECNKDLPIIVGGVHPSSAPETVLLECKSIDFVSLYEGDTGFIDFLNLINGKTQEEKLRQIATVHEGVYYSINNRLRELDIDTTPDYGQLPIGDYHFLGKIGNYHWLLPDNVRAATVLSNRGCRGKCTYCSVNAFYGKGGIVSRDVNSVVDEIDFLKNKYNISHFMWLDDDLLFNEKRAIELFNEITKRNLNITWDATNGVVAASITPEVIDAAHKSGCIGLHIGIESGNPEILKSIRKPSSIKQYIRAAMTLRQYPEIFTKGFLMIGFEGETISKILDTVNLALELQFDWYSIQLLTVFPSTETHRTLLRNEDPRAKALTGKFFFGSTGEMRLVEAREIKYAKEFVNLLEGDPEIIPSGEQLKDVWFLVDYKVNYEKILTENRSVKLIMIQKMLENVCGRIKENPLARLFLGIVEQKLGNCNKAHEQKELARNSLDNSAYWQTRFEVLDLYKLF